MLMNTIIQNNQTRSCMILLTLGVALGMSNQVMAQTKRAPVRDSKFVFSTTVESWSSRKEKNVVMQKKDFSCGAAVLATMIKYYWGGNTSEEILIKDLDEMLNREELNDRIEHGLTMTDLRKLAVRQGYQATIGNLSFRKLTESKIPLIVGVVSDDYDHFVLFRGYDGRWVYLADPSRGNIRVPARKFVDEWQKNMVLVVVKKDSKPRKSSPLYVHSKEIRVGETNQQLMLTIPSRMAGRPGAVR